jgi:hypothetical protein
MKTSHKLFLSALAAAALAACGGGDEVISTTGAGAGAGAGAGGGNTTSAITAETIANTPSPTSAPTAVLVDSQAAADDLSAEAEKGFKAGEAAAGSKGIATSPDNGLEKIAAVINSACPGGGSIDYDYGTLDARGVVAGTTYNITYKDCKYSFGAYTALYNGNYEWKYSRYTAANDFAYTFKYNNLTYTTNYNGTAKSTTLNGGQSCDYTPTKQSCFYSDGTRGWSSNVSYENGVLNGSYAYTYSGGITKVTYTNYSATGGKVLFEGKNTKYELVRTSATAYTWTYTGANGTTVFKYPK